ncbi:ATP-binding cassette domain-containing protein [Alkaliphilus sp. MSJ-5]|uniref:ATP-binding cassette domain-containing protein n=1 Tax=Alkaliphilus flagellatus TaxID=2841507 RepID=A0ABS6FZ66_9FIRM|nr:ATP-binding cassette domain-containing protein [Alkaliphilus flagellatus]MBU5675244.1 ATP-binding cassette domain-containing protein [Alkaliphilus flagellatus]
MNKLLAVHTNCLTKVFSGEEVLKRCSISVNQGEIYGILGANGAGKTTLLKLIAGLLEPTEGNAEVIGMDSHSQKAQLLRQIGIFIETPYFYEHLSASENLSIHLEYMGTSGDIQDALKQVGLSSTGTKPVAQFSLGMRQRLGIARALIHRPQVLLLDEPINGLDPIAIREMRELFGQLKAEGMTLLISSHILSEIEQTADRVGILAYGQLILEESMSALKQQHPNDLENYLIGVMNGGILC